MGPIQYLLTLAEWSVLRRFLTLTKPITLHEFITMMMPGADYQFVYHKLRQLHGYGLMERHETLDMIGGHNFPNIRWRASAEARLSFDQP